MKIHEAKIATFKLDGRKCEAVGEITQRAGGSYGARVVEKCGGKVMDVPVSASGIANEYEARKMYETISANYVKARSKDFKDSFELL